MHKPSFIHCLHKNSSQYAILYYLQVVRELRATSIAWIHGDEDCAGWVKAHLDNRRW